MNIIAQSPAYLPDNFSGGETMLHDYLKLLVDQGHEVGVIADRPSVDNWEGVNVYTRKYQEILYSNCDVAISHLGSIGNSYNKCRKYNKPLIYIAHNDYCCAIVRTHPINVLYNSQWIADKMPYKGASIIGHPIINYDNFKYIKPDGNYITMVNLNENKGGHILKAIAERMPDHKFLAVEGGYGKQVLEQPDNVKILPNGSDMAEVYKASKVVIMPSKYESWGRVAAEAIVSTLPLIHADTPGLKEVAGDSGYMIKERDNIDEWIDIITKAMNGGKLYKYLKANAINRKDELLADAKEDKIKFSIFVDKLAQNGKNS